MTSIATKRRLHVDCRIKVSKEEQYSFTEPYPQEHEIGCLEISFCTKVTSHNSIFSVIFK